MSEPQDVCDLCGRTKRPFSIIEGRYADGQMWHLEFCEECCERIPSLRAPSNEGLRKALDEESALSAYDRERMEEFLRILEEGDLLDAEQREEGDGAA